jgi:superoxide reductase
MMLEVEPFCKPNRVKDPNNKNLLEQKHSPVIEAPSEVEAGEFFNVVIRIGEIEHPNQNDHFIHWIKIYLDDLYLTRTDFTPVMTRPEITLSLKIARKSQETLIRAVTRCNQHGIWESNTIITVK